VLTPEPREQLAHNKHIETKHYEFGWCEACRRLLLEARADHRDHAGYLLADGTWFVAAHTNDQCVTAYCFRALKMSES